MRAELAALAPLSLAELDASAPLLTRMDRKYVAGTESVEALLRALAPTHRVLEIDGRRRFAYRSVYYDSPSLDAFRAHVQGRRRRYKCRTRHYVDADRHVFEVKLKGLRGATVKHQLPLPGAVPDALPGDAVAFAARLVGGDPQRLGLALAPVLATAYSRVTLAAACERVTLDFGLAFEAVDGRRAAIAPGQVVVESKSADGSGAADPALRRLGVRPVPCSKYCVGVALLRDDVRGHSLRWLTRRYFSAGELPAHA